MVYAFDNCELDTQRITLRRAGQTIPMRPKVFQVLLHLLTHRERIVDKQELAEQVWPAQFISDATLESTLRAVRRAIGDSGKEQRIIQTLYSHGYRFVAPVTIQPTTREADQEQARPGSSGPAEPLQGDPGEVAHVPAAPAPGVVPSPRPGGETWRCPVCQHVSHADHAAGCWFCRRCGTSALWRRTSAAGAILRRLRCRPQRTAAAGEPAQGGPDTCRPTRPDDAG